MTPTTRAVLALTAGLALFVAKGCYDDRVIERAGFKRTTDSLRVALGREQRLSDSLALAFRADTVRLTDVVTRWQRFRDTLTLSDTVRLTVRESVLVAVADTAIAQCTRTVTTCEALVASKDSIIGTLKASVKNERHQRLGFFRRTGHTLKWIGVGAVAGILYQRR